MSKGRFIVITGPTASGKTRISVEVAKALDSEIISADSMQIYRGMDIGTAKATHEEMQNIAHHFIDVTDPDDEYSVAEFQTAAFSIIDTLNAQNKVPVITGGTGLYINSLVYKLDFSKTSRNNTLRQNFNALADDKGTEYLYNRLKQKDPKYASMISNNDRRRIVRRLEIIDTVGVQHYNFRQPNDDFDIVMIGLVMPRDVLYKRINERVDQMIDGGLIDEVRAVYNQYGRTNALKAIGYKELIAHFDGEYDLAEAVRLIKRNSRRYAKRQMTWFKKDRRIQWFDTSVHACIEQTINDIIKFIKGKGF